MKFRFSILLAIAALSVAGCAAYFSVYGLSQLFAGASTAVIIMASTLEFSKLIAASFLHRYWNNITKSLKIYLTVGVVVLVTITSGGIYGFLSSAYQESKTKYNLENGEIVLLENKKKLFEKGIKSDEKTIENKTKRVDQLTNLRNTQEARIDSLYKHGNISAAKKVRDDIKNADKEIQKLTLEIDKTNDKIAVLSDSVAVYDNMMLEVESNSSVAAELGPLKYLSELTGKPMDSVVNYFILLLIFVFDPLAISLVIATNKVMTMENEERARNKKEDEPNKDDEIKIDITPTEPIVDENMNQQIEVIRNATEKALESKEASIEFLTEAGIINNEEVIEEIKEEEIKEEEIKEEEIKVEENIEEGVQETIEVNVEESIPVTKEPINEIIEEVKVEEPIKQPVIATGRIERKDIKEVKEQERGFSVKIPKNKSNNGIERMDNNGFDAIIRKK
jgi:hypothetical protein